MKTNYSKDKINTNSSPVCSEIEETLNDIQLGNIKSFSSVEELIKDLNQVDDSLEN
ncbi:hypothetical protein DOK76_12820 [Vagococcus sp. DIV0080]|uniref:Uncharacterized protein n=1 Tax=Candidatus Vagococcus giribetii TaxID=2230876 RepID=A0ABS3HW27_9ENTE|nr:hypothetical protein [Vagococcus sp. DIV0080]MBO0477949.1 hypothetical protein [Vagococcus sp. DIV0080]